MKTLNDLTAPASVVKKVLEADLQEQCVDWARRRGYWARKFSSISQRSVPDYEFARWIRATPGNIGAKVKFATEFKRPGCPLDSETGAMSTPAQVDEQNAMRQAGWIVFECDDFQAFKNHVVAIEEDALGYRNA